MALGGALGLGLVARDAAALCMAGAAQTHIYRRLAWQAWHANSHPSSFCVAGVALMALGAALGLGLVARVALCSNGLTALTLACSQQKKVGGDAACQCLHYLLSCLVTFYILLLEQ